MARLIWHGDRVVEGIKREMLIRGQRAAAAAAQDIQSRLSASGEPAPPGVPLRRRTGRLAQSIQGRARLEGSNVVVEVLSRIPLPRLRWTLARGGLPLGPARRLIRDILTGKR
jgi:hypothetical protein